MIDRSGRDTRPVREPRVHGQRRRLRQVQGTSFAEQCVKRSLRRTDSDQMAGLR
jgi:hypothetical protein